MSLTDTQIVETSLELQHVGWESILRFITCGSVDDGKSTLIGRLLYESKRVFDDQLKALESDSRQYGTQGEKIDFALLVDGLQAEREQGITIDVAYRFFATERRRFIVADTPGHEQYTRNMATGASTASLAVILVDARKGILTQTRRHSRIVSMMGIHHVVLAVNKMDLVNFDPAVFQAIETDYEVFAKTQCAFESIQAIPLSALTGGNIVDKSPHTPWYDGPTLLNYLETVDASSSPTEEAFRMPIQIVNRPNLDFRGFCGRVASGEVKPGDRILVLPSGKETRVKEIIAWEGTKQQARSGDSVTLTLVDELDISRGDILVSAANPAQVADQFEVRMLWMSETPLIQGRSYIAKIHTKEVLATVNEIKYQEDINTGAQLTTRQLRLNEIAVVKITFNQPVVFEPYDINRILGSLILIDRFTFQTLGAGMVEFAYHTSDIRWQTLEIDKRARSNMKGQKAKCIWFTGLSGSGKSTIANMVEKRLHAEGRHTYILDGDNIRHGLNRDLGFTDADRVENIRRVAEVAKLMVDAGLVVLVSFISPYRAERCLARELFEEGEFVEVFVDTSLEECERRDPKGLYAKARRGELKNFTGIDSLYEVPTNPDIHLQTQDRLVEECVEQILEFLGQ